MAIRHRAWLAWRFPPGLRRWRVVLPDDASMGDAPHRAANDASVVSRAGLSPAAMSRIDATSAPMPLAARSAGLAVGELVEMAAQLGDVGVEGLVLAGQGAQSDLCRLGGLGGVAGTEPSAPSHPLRSRERLQGAAQPVGSSDDEIADLIGDAGAMSTRRAQHDPDRPDRLHNPVAALGSRGRLAVERSAGRGLGVDGVGLAAAATHLTVRPAHLDHLDHLDTRADQVARQPRPIRAGALHADAHHRAERPQPLCEPAIPRRVRPERRRGEHPARLVGRRSDVDLLVRVDAPVDADRLISHDEPCLSCQ